MYIIHAYIKVDSNQQEKFLEQAKDLIAGSRAEEGNISYQLYQDTNETNAFVMVEEWKDMEAIKYHGQTEHYKRFGVNTKDLLSAPTNVKRFEVKEVL